MRRAHGPVTICGNGSVFGLQQCHVSLYVYFKPSPVPGGTPQCAARLVKPLRKYIVQLHGMSMLALFFFSKQLALILPRFTITPPLSLSFFLYSTSFSRVPALML